MNEFELIARLTRGLATGPGVVVGPGDDCAVLEAGWPEHWLLFKTDAVVEGVHFAPDAPPERIGHKALGRALSDLAAMGGEATAALVTLGVPAPVDAERLEAIYRGLNALATRYGVALVGGETTRSTAGLFLSVAVLGRVAKRGCVRRRGAQAGDALFVSGELGGSIAGRHLDFEPRLREARWLVEHFAVHAMIDLSDGLAGDLRHVLQASGVGAELRAASIPISPAARRRGRTSEAREGIAVPVRPEGPPPLVAALTDGEDFELLFAVAPGDAVPLLDGWKRAFPEVRLSCIGRITAAPGLRLQDQHGVREFTGAGYTHFGA